MYIFLKYLLPSLLYKTVSILLSQVFNGAQLLNIPVDRLLKTTSLCILIDLQKITFRGSLIHYLMINYKTTRTLYYIYQSILYCYIVFSLQFLCKKSLNNIICYYLLKSRFLNLCWYK